MDDRPLRSARLRAGTLTVQSGISPSSFAAERYRTVAVRLEQPLQMTKNSGYLLGVTSPEPAAGKTLTSLNLALTLARMGDRRVLLVEGDLWRPNLSAYLEMEGEIPGLGQILEKDAELDEAIVSIWGTGLHALTAGASRRQENLIFDRRMGQTLVELRSLYEIVVLDSAPILLASGQTLASLADGVLLVVRAGQTKRTDIEEALSILEPNQVLGLLPNAVRREKVTSTAYGAYGQYGSERAPTFGEPTPSEDAGAGMRPRVTDLRPWSVGAGGRARPRQRRWWSSWPLGWRVGLAGLALVIAAGLAAFFLRDEPGGDAASTGIGVPRSVGAPVAGPPDSQVNKIELQQETTAKLPLGEPQLLPATGQTSVMVPLRSGPGTDYPVLTVLAAGSRFVTLETDGDWLRIQDNSDREGWLLRALVVMEDRVDPAEGTEAEPPL